MDDLLEQFLIEGGELVQQASEDLLALERDPLESDALGEEAAFPERDAQLVIAPLGGDLGVIERLESVLASDVGDGL